MNSPGDATGSTPGDATDSPDTPGPGDSGPGDSGPGDSGPGDSGPGDSGPQPGSIVYVDVTDSHLPAADLDKLSMDVEPIDVDGDGDLDLMIANEHRSNILLINDGSGHFTNESNPRIPRVSFDSEDVGIADFDNDGDLDIVVVSEDNQTNELYFNDGSGTFTDEGTRLPVTGTTNGVVTGDVDGDGDLDLVLANAGQNVLVLSDGAGTLVDATDRMPVVNDVSQDVDLGDVDGDGDLDLLVGNEGDNKLLLNDGTGHFTDVSAARLPQRNTPEETREADFGDADGDGDLDIFFANVQFFVSGAVLENRLLINNGSGVFTDETAARLPQHNDHTVDGDFVDVDGDGDLDLVTANAINLQEGAPYRALLNDGKGTFRDGTAEIFPDTMTGIGFDIEAADLNGDGLLDFYGANRRGIDRLLLGKAP